MITRLLLLSALLVTPWTPPDTQGAAREQGPPMRNPAFLRASELLGRPVAGVAPRIRFEWERVPGSNGYVLAGQWTDPQSWAVRSQEYRVTARNASSWEGDKIAFDVSLPEGTHSWTIVAVFGPHDVGDFESPAHISFTLR